MVSMIEIDFRLDVFSDSLDVVTRNCGEEVFGFFDIDLLAPFADVDGVEATSYSLTARVLFDEPVCYQMSAKNKKLWQ